MNLVLYWLMLTCFAAVGLNIWALIPPHHGEWYNAVAAAIALGAGLYALIGATQERR